jgi:hypothetical protein
MPRERGYPVAELFVLVVFCLAMGIGAVIVEHVPFVRTWLHGPDGEDWAEESRGPQRW